MKLIQSGPRDARIVIVGESPTPSEVASGRPLDGGAGHIFDRCLNNARILRGSCFITNVVHVAAPNATPRQKGKFEGFTTKSNFHLYAGGVVQLKKDLEAIQPNLVIALGQHALMALTGKKGIDKWRGSILPCTLVPGLKVLGTYDPDQCLRTYDYKAIVEVDLRRAAFESTFKPIIRTPRRYLLHNTRVTTAADGQQHERALHVGELDRWVGKLERAEWLAIDIECWQRDDGTWSLACVGFSDTASRALVIHNDGPASLNTIQRLLSSPSKKVYQNGTFDVTVLRNEGLRVDNFGWDTMLGHHVLFIECAGGEDEESARTGKKRQAAIRKGLAFQASIYTKEPFYKDDGKIWRETGDLKTFWLYNARDVAVTREIRDVQEKELVAFGQMHIFEHKMRMVEPLMRSTNRGIKIDMDKRASIHADIENQIANLQRFLDGAAGEVLNVKSTPQITKFLYDTLKLPVKYNRKSGNVTGNKDAINELAAKHSHPALQAILKIRERRDLIERYLNAAVDADKRMRCSFDITGTRTDRLASRASIYGSGTNLQNIPSRKKVGEQIRSMFVADEGYVFINRDYKQADAFIVAYLAECKGLIELFEDPTRDLHRENASRLFNKPVSQVTDEERYLAKRIIHASNYGMETDKFVRVVNEDYESTGFRVEYHQAKVLLEKYFIIYPEIKSNFWKRTEQELKDQKMMLINPIGRKRIFYGRFDDKLVRDAYSWKPQSTVGYLGGEAVSRTDEAFSRAGLDADVLLQVHDSVLSQTRVGTVLQAAELAREAMREKITIYDRTFEIPTDCSVGLNWGKRSKDNPNGLIDLEKGGREWLTTIR
jgi:uracil-DNA glycosylase family 4